MPTKGRGIYNGGIKCCQHCPKEERDKYKPRNCHVVCEEYLKQKEEWEEYKKQLNKAKEKQNILDKPVKKKHKRQFYRMYK